MADPKPMQKLRIVNQGGEETTFVCKDQEVRDALTDSVNVAFDNATLSVSGSKQDGYTVGVPTFAGPDTTGLVPKPVASDANKVLSGSGRWITVSTQQPITGFTLERTDLYEETYVNCHAFTECGTVPDTLTQIKITFGKLSSMQSYMADGIVQFTVLDTIPEIEVNVDGRRVATIGATELHSRKVYQIHLFNLYAVMYEFDYAPLTISLANCTQETDDLVIGFTTENDSDVYKYDLYIDDSQYNSYYPEYSDDMQNISVSSSYLYPANEDHTIRLVALDASYNEIDAFETTVFIKDPFQMIADSLTVDIDPEYNWRQISTSLAGDSDVIAYSGWTSMAQYPWQYEISYPGLSGTYSYVSPASSYSGYSFYTTDDFSYSIGDSLSLTNGNDPTLVPGDITLTASICSAFGTKITGSKTFTITDPLAEYFVSFSETITYTIDDYDEVQHLVVDLTSLSIDEDILIDEVELIVNGNSTWIDRSYLGSTLDATDQYEIDADNISTVELYIVSGCTTYPSTGTPYKYSNRLSITAA